MNTAVKTNLTDLPYRFLSYGCNVCAHSQMAKRLINTGLINHRGAVKMSAIFQHPVEIHLKTQFFLYVFNFD